MLQEERRIGKESSKNRLHILRIDSECGSGDEFSESARFMAEVQSVKSFPGNDQKVQRGGVRAPGGGNNQGAKARDEADGGESKGVHDGRNREQALNAVQSERTAMAPGIPEKRGDQEKNRSKTERVKREPAVDLNRCRTPRRRRIAKQI